MVYAHEPALHTLHDNVAAFIDATDNLKPPAPAPAPAPAQH
jgi:hypothetical protein